MRASLLLLLTGCHSIAAIEDVTLATDTAVVDSTTSETGGDTLTSDTSASDSETETAAETGDCASSRGPAMVAIAHPGGAFCIDATEVTNEQFAEYAKLPPSITLPERCMGVVQKYPGTVGDAKAPQFNVGWCDAFAFCAWAGKRLCGVLDKAKPLGGDNSEWSYVCTQGGSTAFPYGDAHDPGACVIGKTAGDALPEPVASFAGCAGKTEPYASVFDLSGNVSEWVDECEGTRCRALGGYFGDTDTQALRCASINSGTGMTVSHEVSTVLRGLGFRCCKD